MAGAMTSALAVLLPGLMFSGYLSTFSDVPIASFALVAFAPMLTWLGVLKPFAECERRIAAVALVAIVCVPLTIAVVLAKMA